jgi:hypothetical protein
MEAFWILRSISSVRTKYTISLCTDTAKSSREDSLQPKSSRVGPFANDYNRRERCRDTIDVEHATVS